MLFTLPTPPRTLSQLTHPCMCRRCSCLGRADCGCGTASAEEEFALPSAPEQLEQGRRARAAFRLRVLRAELERLQLRVASHLTAEGRKETLRLMDAPEAAIEAVAVVSGGGGGGGKKKNKNKKKKKKQGPAQPADEEAEAGAEDEEEKADCKENGGDDGADEQPGECRSAADDVRRVAGEVETEDEDEDEFAGMPALIPID